MEYCNAVFEFMIIYAGDLKTDIFSKLVVAVALELRVKIDRKMNTFIYICSSELTDKLSDKPLRMEPCQCFYRQWVAVVLEVVN